MAGILVTHKFYTDNFYLNKDICTVGAVSLKALNDMEEEFLSILNFDLTVDEETYNRHLNGIQLFFSKPLDNEMVSIIDEIKMSIQVMEQQEMSQRLGLSAASGGQLSSSNSLTQ